MTPESLIGVCKGNSGFGSAENETEQDWKRHDEVGGACNLQTFQTSSVGGP